MYTRCCTVRWKLFNQIALVFHIITYIILKVWYYMLWYLLSMQREAFALLQTSNRCIISLLPSPHMSVRHISLVWTSDQYICLLWGSNSTNLAFWIWFSGRIWCWEPSRRDRWILTPSAKIKISTERVRILVYKIAICGNVLNTCILIVFFVYIYLYMDG